MMKTVVLESTKKKAAPKQLDMPRTAQYYGTWGRVVARNSKDHSVDLVLSEGYQVTNIPVASKEWVTLKGDSILGERDLPPVESVVFVLMPTGSIESAFVLTSCFLPILDKHTEEFLVEGKESEKYTVLEGKWTKKYDKTSGDMEIVGTDDDGKTLMLSISKSEKKIHICDWNENDVVIDENGINIKSASKTIIESGSKVVVKNAAQSLAALVGELIDDLVGLQTIGPPPQHTVSPASIAKLNALKTKFDALLET
jgi:hypothetical protein